MDIKYMHVGTPMTNKQPGMTYKEELKVWITEPTDSLYKFEYLKFEEGTPFPQIMHKNPHVAYQVDDAEPFIAAADQIIFGPVTNDDGSRMCFILKDDVIFELMEVKP